MWDSVVEPPWPCWPTVPSKQHKCCAGNAAQQSWVAFTILIQAVLSFLLVQQPGGPSMPDSQEPRNASRQCLSQHIITLTGLGVARVVAVAVDCHAGRDVDESLAVAVADKVAGRRWEGRVGAREGRDHAQRACIGRGERARGSNQRCAAGRAGAAATAAGRDEWGFRSMGSCYGYTLLSLAIQCVVWLHVTVPSQPYTA